MLALLMPSNAVPHVCSGSLRPCRATCSDNRTSSRFIVTFVSSAFRNIAQEAQKQPLVKAAQQHRFKHVSKHRHRYGISFVARKNIKEHLPQDFDTLTLPTAYHTSSAAAMAITTCAPPLMSRVAYKCASNSCMPHCQPLVNGLSSVPWS